jgi:hypothetical protein
MWAFGGFLLVLGLNLVFLLALNHLNHASSLFGFGYF